MPLMSRDGDTKFVADALVPFMTARGWVIVTDGDPLPPQGAVQAFDRPLRQYVPTTVDQLFLVSTTAVNLVAAALATNPALTGRGISSITRTAGNGAPGTTDTYTIAYTSGSPTTFTVTNGTAGGSDDPNALKKAQNLNDLADKPTARTNLGLADAAVRGTGTAAGQVPVVQAGGKLDPAVVNDADALKKAQNLADLANAATARTNLGLGTAATATTGTAAGNVPVLNANGRVDPARLGGGTADATTVLYGDGSFKTPAGATSGLGYATYNTAGNIAITATSASASQEVNSAGLTVTFTAPASGSVDVVLEGCVNVTANMYWTVRSGGSLVAGTSRSITSSATRQRHRVAIRVTGLTPGTSYTYRWGAFVTSGEHYITAGNDTGPLTMEVRAA